MRYLKRKDCDQRVDYVLSLARGTYSPLGTAELSLRVIAMSIIIFEYNEAMDGARKLDMQKVIKVINKTIPEKY